MTDNGQTWAKKLIHLLWRYFLDTWKLRCDARHERDIHRVSRQHTNRVQVRTRAVYDSLDRLPAITRSSHYFDLAYDIRITQTTRDLETWLVHAESLVSHGLAEAARAVTAGHQDIRNYFQPQYIPPPPD